MTLQTSLSTKIYHISPFIQQLEFPQVAFFTSANETNLLAAGTYPPQLRIFDLGTTTMKMQRNLTAEAVSAEFIGEDWKKLALLQNNRVLEVHGQGGSIFSHRIPFVPRCGVYDPYSACYIACGDANYLVALDLHEGRFRGAIEGFSQAYDSLVFCNRHAVLYGAGVAGISAFDSREGRELSRLVNERCCSLAISADGMRIAAGGASGKILVYDIRASTPLQVVEVSQNPVKETQFHKIYDTEHLLAHDGREIRGYDAERKLKFYIDPPSEIEHFELFPKSGFILASCQADVVENYYIPDLGPAPAWASDLESQIASIDALQQQSQYENCRFVTEYELKELNLQQLATTDAVIPQMHGFWIKNDIFQAAVRGVAPDEVQATEKQRAVEQFRAEREGLILRDEVDEEEQEEELDDRFKEALREIAGEKRRTSIAEKKFKEPRK